MVYHNKMSSLRVYLPDLSPCTHFSRFWQSSSLENVAPQVLRRVAKEISELSASSPDGIKVIVNEEDITDIQAVILGPGNQ